MNKVSSVALISLLLGSLVGGAGYFQVHRTTLAVTVLMERCEEENALLAARPPISDEPWHNDPTVCDPPLYPGVATLKAGNGGIQHQIAVAHSKVFDAHWVYALASAFVVLGCLPWTWYFLLRRVREVAHAITGK